MAAGDIPRKFSSYREYCRLLFPLCLWSWFLPLPLSFRSCFLSQWSLILHPLNWNWDLAGQTGSEGVKSKREGGWLRHCFVCMPRKENGSEGSGEKEVNIENKGVEERWRREERWDDAATSKLDFRGWGSRECHSVSTAAPSDDDTAERERGWNWLSITRLAPATELFARFTLPVCILYRSVGDI